MPDFLEMFLLQALWPLIYPLHMRARPVTGVATRHVQTWQIDLVIKIAVPNGNNQALRIVIFSKLPWTISCPTLSSKLAAAFILSHHGLITTNVANGDFGLHTLIFLPVHSILCMLITTAYLHLQPLQRTPPTPKHHRKQE